jgi:hypothetical protein
MKRLNFSVPVTLRKYLYNKSCAESTPSECCALSAPDFYFCVNAIARHLHDEYGMSLLVDYWQSLGREYYEQRVANWHGGGPRKIADDWQEYFLHEPGAEVEIVADDNQATLNIRVCPAIKHLRDSGREIVPYFCEHCDHVCGSMAAVAGFRFERTGGMGSCQQRFTALTLKTTESEAH